jgi:hypothetical protein
MNTDLDLVRFGFAVFWGGRAEGDPVSAAILDHAI